MDKDELRNFAKKTRKQLDIKAKSEILIEKIRRQEVYQKSKNVMLYYPMRYELNLLSLLKDDKNFYLPRVCGENLMICPFKSGDELKKSDFNVCEPCTEPINPKKLDLVIVPALMADTEGYRLGYGGGFYDRFLEKYSSIKTILPIAKELYVEKLPHNIYDKKVDEIIVA